MSYFSVKNCAPVTYSADGARKIYNFLPGDGGGPDNYNLYVEYWDAGRWQTANLGSAGSPINSFHPAALTFRDGDRQLLYAFVHTDDDHVRASWWDGGQWRWHDLGSPGRRITADLAAVLHEENGLLKIYVFAVCGDGHLWVCWWDGARWNWQDQGIPRRSVDVVDRPTALSFREGTDGRIYVFVRTSDHHLAVNYWDGSGEWKWADQGSVGSRFGMSAVTYEEDGRRKMYVFTLTEDRLHINWWDGSRWQWARAQSPEVHRGSALSAISYEEGNVRKLYVFVVADDRIHIRYWDGSGEWRWDHERGTPGLAIWAPAAITFNEQGINKIYAFVTGLDRRPHCLWWDGHQWSWYSFRSRR